MTGRIMAQCDPGAVAGGGVTLQIIRDWVLKFDADGPDGLINYKAPGHQPHGDCLKAFRSPARAEV